MCDGDTSKCIACRGGILGNPGSCAGHKRCKKHKCHYCSTSDESCFKCYDNYSLNDENVCVFGLRHCLKLKNNNLEECLICENGYYLNKERKCITNTKFIFSTTLKLIAFSIGILICLILFFCKVWECKKL